MNSKLFKQFEVQFRLLFRAILLAALVFPYSTANSEEDTNLSKEWFVLDRLTTFKVKFEVIDSKDDDTYLHIGVIRKGPLHIYANWEQSGKIEWPSGSTRTISLNDQNPMIRKDAESSYIGFCIYPTGDDTFEFTYTLTAWSTKEKKRVNLASNHLTLTESSRCGSGNTHR